MNNGIKTIAVRITEITKRHFRILGYKVEFFRRLVGY